MRVKEVCSDSWACQGQESSGLFGSYESAVSFRGLELMMVMVQGSYRARRENDRCSAALDHRKNAILYRQHKHKPYIITSGGTIFTLQSPRKPGRDGVGHEDDGDVLLHA